MLRIIDGYVYEGKPSSDQYNVKMIDLGHGHREALVNRATVWEEVGHVSEQKWRYHLEMLDEMSPELRKKLDEEKAERNANRAARRAKTKVRQLCKAMGVDALLTLTYRDNITDMDVCKAHVKEFVRRMRRVLPGFAYVAAFERQKRGAWHVHMAIHALPFQLPWAGVKVKSYSVVRGIWRAVAGAAGGNIDQARRKRNSRKTSAQIASYVSKYITKAFNEGAQFVNRYSASAVDMPQAVRMRLQGSSLADIIGLVYLHMGGAGTITRPWISGWGDVFFMSSEPDPHANIG